MHLHTQHLSRFALWGLLLFFSSPLFSQKKWEFGIKAGVNLSSVVGASETDSLGNGLESKRLGFRLMAGAYARYRVGPRMSLQAELNYVQKGTPTTFEGPSYQEPLAFGFPTLTQGRRTQSLNPTLNYLEMPLLFGFEAIENKLEISAGPSFGFLFGATAVGNSRYSGDPELGNQTIEYDLDYRYGRDEAGAAKTNAVSTVVVNGDNFQYPNILGAHYFETQSELDQIGKMPYRPFDLGLNIGATYRFSGSLRFGFRWQYSLLDITDNRNDRSLVRPDTFLSTVDRNMGFKLFIGFGF
jgi:hypothetical protein